MGSEMCIRDRLNKDQKNVCVLNKKFIFLPTGPTHSGMFSQSTVSVLLPIIQLGFPPVSAREQV